MTSLEQKQFLEQVRSLGMNVLCLNSDQQNLNKMLGQVMKEGEMVILMNSNKLNKQIEQEESKSIPMLQCSQNSFLQPFYQQASQLQQLAQVSRTNSSPLFQTTLPSLFPQASPFSPFMQSTSAQLQSSNISVSPYSSNMLNQPLFFQQPQAFNIFQQQQQQTLFQLPSISMNQGSSTTNLQIPLLFNNQELNFKQNVNPLSHIQNLLSYLPVQQSQLQVAQVSKNISSQQIDASMNVKSFLKGEDEEDEICASKRETVHGHPPKQRHGLFKKKHSNSSKKSQDQFKIKLEGNGSGSTSQNCSLPSNEGSNDSFSEEGLAADNICSSSKRRSTETNTQMTLAEIEKQNKIKERRKTNNFGHIYTWLKNQIRLYFGDRELYEKIQSYFTRVNKYNEVVTDESSSKWQFFLFQIKDNTALKTFLKDKIKSEQFKEYIKTRKGKDQKVFYEFRIGVIYGIDHPELSNQPKNCLLMAKKDPEYCQIHFGW